MLVGVVLMVFLMVTRASPTLTLAARALLERPKACPAKLVEAHAVAAAIATTRRERAKVEL